MPDKFIGISPLIFLTKRKTQNVYINQSQPDFLKK